MKDSSSMGMGKIKKELASTQENDGQMAMSKASSPNQQEESDEWTEQLLRLISEREKTQKREEDKYKKSLEEAKVREESHVARLAELQKSLEEAKVRMESHVARHAELQKSLEEAKVREESHVARLAELQSRNKYLEREVRAADVKVELYNTRFEELRSTTSSMEEDTKVLMNELKLLRSTPLVVEELGAAANAARLNDEDMADPHCGDQETDSSQVACRAKATEEDGPSNSVMNIGKKLASESVRLDSRVVSTVQSNEGHGPRVIVIDDSDDDPMEDNLAVSASKRKRAESDDSSSDSEDGARNSSTTWENESDLILALEKCPELCMRAVCAIYREKYFDLVLLPNTQNTDKADALRGTKLAEFLIGGNPQATLKKSIPELQKHDPRGLEDCSRLAIRYSKKLFDIYTKFGDPFFLPY